MDYTTESGESMTPFSFRNHTALLLCHALPYLQPAYRHPIELTMKFLEFSETLRLFQEFHSADGNLLHSFLRSSGQKSNTDTGLFGMLNTFVLDFEGLLRSLSSVCTGSEKEIVGMFLNLIRAKSFYDTYGDFLKSAFTSDLFSSGAGSAASPDVSGILGGLASAPLNEEQMDTLSLLKSLFINEEE